MLQSFQKNIRIKDMETEKKAKSMGVARIDLMVWEFNKHAIELYASLGMKTQRYIFEKEI